MCLLFDPCSTRCFKEQNKSQTVELYKVVSLRKRNLYSSDYPHLWKPGWNTSDRDSIDFDELDKSGVVNRGIHVYLNLKVAEEHAASILNGRVMIVIGKMVDLVGCDNKLDKAVFTKVLLTQIMHHTATQIQFSNWN